MTNADRMFESYMNGYYAYNKKDTMKIFNDIEIFIANTQIGYIEDLECEDGVYHTFVIISLQFYKTYKTQIKQIVKAAQDVGYFVIFTNVIDIGFGVPHIYETDETHIKRLMAIYKLGYSPARKNAVAMVDNLYNASTDLLNTYAFYCMSQYIENVIYSPEEILKLYLTSEDRIMHTHRYICIKQPVAAYLEYLIDAGANNIGYYMSEEEDKTYDWELVDRVLSRDQLSVSGTPIAYNKYKSKEVEKFFAKEE